MKYLNPQDVKAQIEQGGAFLLDVRGFDEFAACRAPGAVCIPLADLERRAGDIPTDCTVVLTCASGNRSKMAAERLRALGMNHIVELQGGMKAWEAAGLPTLKQRGVIPLERQVRGVAGALVFASVALGLSIHPAWHFGALFVGFMLFLSAVTGLCPMLSLLKLMPWNRVAASLASAS